MNLRLSLLTASLTLAGSALTMFQAGESFLEPVAVHLPVAHPFGGAQFGLEPVASAPADQTVR